MRQGRPQPTKDTPRRIQKVDPSIAITGPCRVEVERASKKSQANACDVHQAQSRLFAIKPKIASRACQDYQGTPSSQAVD